MTLERVFKISQRNLAPTRTQFSLDKINLNSSDSDISLELSLKKTPAISLKTCWRRSLYFEQLKITWNSSSTTPSSHISHIRLLTGVPLYLPVYNLIGATPHRNLTITNLCFLDIILVTYDSGLKLFLNVQYVLNLLPPFLPISS